MIKVNKKSINLIALIILIISILTTNVYALNPDDYPHKGPTKQDAGSFLDKAGTVIGVVKNVGIIISVIALSIIGLKYIFSSVEGKAEYKKTMVPYIVGCCMLMCASIIVGIIQNIAQ